ncbi:DUF4148 domain-containing protein [Paraburkholderia oxyphila]|uniref:DUF4148 domain-containing protein n=1 Tax=Paraburkholderia oxyphila TaxID=614212 RepID=UPI000A01886E|nr:DUF4148 domain-containing protein [Paraburkholderia oxyphila]
MKRFYLAAIVVSAMSLPLVSHAQPATTQTTRAQVRAELIAAEQAGQYPRSRLYYPDAAPNAAVEYVADRDAARTANQGAYGFPGAGRSESGFLHRREHAVTLAQPDSTDIYRGH